MNQIEPIEFTSANGKTRYIVDGDKVRTLRNRNGDWIAGEVMQCASNELAVNYARYASGQIDSKEYIRVWSESDTWKQAIAG